MCTLCNDIKNSCTFYNTRDIHTDVFDPNVDCLLVGVGHDVDELMFHLPGHDGHQVACIRIREVRLRPVDHGFERSHIGWQLHPQLIEFFCKAFHRLVGTMR